jgi:hypothetical protein
MLEELDDDLASRGSAFSTIALVSSGITPSKTPL